MKLVSLWLIEHHCFMLMTCDVISMMNYGFVVYSLSNLRYEGKCLAGEFY